MKKIDKLVEDIYESIKDIQTGITDSHTLDFFFYDDSSINIDLIEENNKISKIGLIGWFVDKNDKSYTDNFREEFRNKLQNKLNEITL